MNVKRIYLEITVFICGAVVMAYEIIGSRMLGPYVGTSYFVWTSIIGIILLSLSIGYFTGGRLADRKPSNELLSFIILLGGVFIFVTTFVKDWLLELLLQNIFNLNLVSVLSSITLFTVPSVLLGMVSPFAARLRMKSLAGSGRTVGNLYAISTIGSIAGVFLAGFYLIPSFSISNILILLSIGLILVSLFINLAHPKTSIPVSHEKN